MSRRGARGRTAWRRDVWLQCASLGEGFVAPSSFKNFRRGVRASAAYHCNSSIHEAPRSAKEDLRHERRQAPKGSVPLQPLHDAHSAALVLRGTPSSTNSQRSHPPPFVWGGTPNHPSLLLPAHNTTLLAHAELPLPPATATNKPSLPCDRTASLHHAPRTLLRASSHTITSCCLGGSNFPRRPCRAPAAAAPRSPARVHQAEAGSWVLQVGEHAWGTRGHDAHERGLLTAPSPQPLPGSARSHFAGLGVPARRCIMPRSTTHAPAEAPRAPCSLLAPNPKHAPCARIRNHPHRSTGPMPPVDASPRLLRVPLDHYVRPGDENRLFPAYRSYLPRDAVLQVR